MFTALAGIPQANADIESEWIVVEKLAEGAGTGPEDIAFDAEGHMYARIEVTVKDSSGQVVSGPHVQEVTLESIRNAVLNVRLRLGHIIPEKSALLQNYPNPFNPETWVPFQLRESDSGSDPNLRNSLAIPPEICYPFLIIKNVIGWLLSVCFCFSCL